MNKLLQPLLLALVAGLVAGLVLLGGLWLVGKQSAEPLDSFGAAIGITRFPNSGIAARAAYFGTSIPSSNLGGCT